MLRCNIWKRTASVTFFQGTVILIGRPRDGKFRLLFWLVSQAGNQLLFVQIQKVFISYYIYFFLKKAVVKLGMG